MSRVSEDTELEELSGKGLSDAGDRGKKMNASFEEEVFAVVWPLISIFLSWFSSALLCSFPWRNGWPECPARTVQVIREKMVHSLYAIEWILKDGLSQLLQMLSKWLNFGIENAGPPLIITSVFHEIFSLLRLSLNLSALWSLPAQPIGAIFTMACLSISLTRVLLFPLCHSKSKLLFASRPWPLVFKKFRKGGDRCVMRGSLWLSS